MPGNWIKVLHFRGSDWRTNSQVPGSSSLKVVEVCQNYERLALIRVRKRFMAYVAYFAVVFNLIMHINIL